ncbi:hypothetical protein [Mycolicibacterium thermoresistibile]|uniref:Uncharacterized protein n=2 Tax=Mycolicibacterium thermoresistibile TaxID=1797 RepID=G7CCX1_MYCT3|nr:hypothetical protein [Mycolicibacterium thermoresistibile]EHI14131.1 hypothetical protein KEK_04097 [Mycolicibacterium thermoresistibile ATCC 19527]MCV7189801.1 hypothetical protein [Mycolicibacterium thermoresistibile]GAT17578.1 putative uncharacterized protein [Mycolicibacterium thermoresistibile]SNW20735.1 Uncharacterised protein [Mycolicibacterium thermoresistibile]
MSPLDPTTVSGIHGMRYDGATLSLRQDLTTALVDHRGELEMAAYAVLADISHTRA